jgi:hypothetical protein
LSPGCLTAKYNNQIKRSDTSTMEDEPS